MEVLMYVPSAMITHVSLKVDLFKGTLAYLKRNYNLWMKWNGDNIRNGNNIIDLSVYALGTTHYTPPEW